jgi:large subunit ribosomal protein L5
MADTKEKQEKQEKQPKKGGADAGGSPKGKEYKGGEPKGKEQKGKKPKKGPDGGAPAPAQPEGPPPEPAPRPRLLEHYEQRVRPKLQQQFGFTNPHQIPRLVKIVLNVGMGAAQKNPKSLETAVTELAAITGQQPVVTRAKKAIANFNLREGMPIGCAVAYAVA